MQTRRLVLVLTGIIVALVVVIGGIAIALVVGGGDDGGPSTGQQQRQTPEADSSPAPELPGRVSGELRLFGPDPITLDPALASDTGSAQYIVEIYSGLLTFDKDLNLVPDIAESIPEPRFNPDGTVSYTFKIRRGVLFHDSSRQVTAADFKYSMERALNPSTQSTVALVYLDDIVGAKDFARGRAQEVRGIRTPDPNDPFTLEIIIDAPKSYFLAKLTYPTAYVVKREQVEGNPRGWTQRPIGTGPFRLREWRLGQSIVLEPNPNYYGTPKPSLARVSYLLAGGSALTMYENNEVDVAGVGLNDIEAVRDPSNRLNKEFQEVPELSTFYIGFNASKPPFNDASGVLLRQALAMAIDKDTLVRVVLRNLAVAAKGVLPPGMPGFDASLQGLPFDPAEAKRLLEQAGGPSKLAGINLLVSGGGGTPGPVLEAILAMWEQNLGVRINIQQEDFATFLRDVDRQRFDIFSLGWIADYVDPQNFLDIKFHSQSLNNETKYASPQVDALLEQARTEPDLQKRLQLYRQAEQIIVQDAPWIPLIHAKASFVVKPYVKGFFNPPFIIEILRYVTVERR